MKKYEEIHVTEDQVAVSMVPALEGQLAIVYFDTIMRLASYLPKANWRQIRDEIIQDLQNSAGLENILEIMENEIKFHKSVNIIQEYKPEQVEPEGSHSMEEL